MPETVVIDVSEDLGSTTRSTKQKTSAKTKETKRPASKNTKSK